MWMTEDEESLLRCCSCNSLLRDPLLLHCLHNICSKCSEQVRIAKGSSTLLVCPACKVETTQETGINKENLFVAGQVNELEKLKNASRCSVCVQSGVTEKTADEWCSKCQMSMCGKCSSDHYLENRDHWPTSLAEVCSIKDLFEPSVHKCRRHGKTYDLICWTCKIPACLSCAKECYHNTHHVEILDTQRTWDHFESIKDYICHTQACLDSKRDILQMCKNVVNKLDVAQASDIKELQTNKRAAADSLNKAYDAAEAALKEHYSRLHAKALALQQHVELMDVRASHAFMYSRYLVASSDKIGLLHQEPVLLSGLQSLVKELDEIRAPQDATKLVAVVGDMPADLDDHTSAWIGMPKLLTDDLCCSAETIAKLETDLRKRLRLGLRSQSQQYDNQSSDISDDVSDVGTACSTFQSPVECWDMAVSADGCRLLLAAKADGLKEFDLSGAELSSWRPAEKAAEGEDEVVGTVEALLDGRVAVGLRQSQCLVVLRRRRSWQKGAAWLEDKRMTALQIVPRRLSIHIDLVAVAGPGQGERKTSLGRSLSLLRLCCGQVVSRQQREYGIGGVAVTANAVLTASYGKVKLSDGGEASVVDACSHEGQLLWRHDPGDGVWDMCAAPSGVLYMALECTNRVTALRAADGSVIKDVMTSISHGLKSPWRLSVNLRGQQTVAAVMSDDGMTVTVYERSLDNERTSSTHTSDADDPRQ